MKIQVASDLHLEFLSRFPGERLITPAPDADVLILAGDISNGTDAIGLFSSWPVPVVYVAGNHEFYGNHWGDLRAKLLRAATGTSVHFLDNDSVVIDGVRFLGSTLWTDFRIQGFTQSSAMEVVEHTLNDYRLIRTAEGTLSARVTLDDHEYSRAWLKRELEVPFAGRTVVVTHHGPHPLSIHSRYGGSADNAGFVSDLSELLPMAKIWLHGHVHDSFDYVIHGCRVVANPAGYFLSLRRTVPASDPVLENRAFNKSLVIDLERDQPP